MELKSIVSLHTKFANHWSWQYSIISKPWKQRGGTSFLWEDAWAVVQRLLLAAMQPYRLYLSRKNGGAIVLRGQIWASYAARSPPSPCSSYSVLKIDVRPWPRSRWPSRQLLG